MKLFVKTGDSDDAVEYGDGVIGNIKKTTWESLPQPLIIDSGGIDFGTTAKVVRACADTGDGRLPSRRTLHRGKRHTTKAKRL